MIALLVDIKFTPKQTACDPAEPWLRCHAEGAALACGMMHREHYLPHVVAQSNLCNIPIIGHLNICFFSNLMPLFVLFALKILSASHVQLMRSDGAFAWRSKVDQAWGDPVPSGVRAIRPEQTRAELCFALHPLLLPRIIARPSRKHPLLPA